MPSPARSAAFKVSAGPVTINERGLKQLLDGQVSKYFRGVSEAIKAEAHRNLSGRMVNVDSGDLRASLRTESRALANSRRRFTVTANTSYAVHVHEGFTHNRSGQHIPGRPYLKAAIDRIVGDVFR